MHIVLASSSPRRRELLSLMGYNFDVITKDVNEDFLDELSIVDNSLNVSYKKASSVYNDINDDVIVIGSDTIVVSDNKVFGKPKDMVDAYNMIKSISGKCHSVISSYCVLVRCDGHEYKYNDYDKCDVYVDNMSDDEINDWINNHDVLTRAGAYAIQDGFMKYVNKIEGDYFSIVGFPVNSIYKILKKYI